MNNNIADRIADIKSKIGNAVLTAVSKNNPVSRIREAIGAGHRVFGENRVKEAMEKFVSLKEEFPDIELHMIGALQTNKALMAAKLFDVIETIDRPELAKAVSAAIMKIGKKPRLYMEVNVGGETQKSGIEYDKAEKFLRFCLEECNLEIEGLMCIPPQGENPEPYFEKMRLLKEKLNMKHLSMGMSEDYRIAVKFGATEVRIGSAIFK